MQIMNFNAFLESTNSIDIKKTEEYWLKQNALDFPISNYISKIYGKPPCCIHFDETFSSNLILHLKDIAKIANFSVNGSINKISNDFQCYRGGTFWFIYQNIIIRAIVKGEDGGDDHFWDGENDLSKNKGNQKKFNVSLFFPHGENIPFDIFKPYIATTSDPKIRLFIKSAYGELTFEPLDIKVPKNMDIELNYGSSFIPVYDDIKKKLIENSNGLYMFHGSPGTGKSSLIKTLTKDVPRNFIYIPTTMLDTFTTNPTALHMLISQANSVLVLEDAEKLIAKRHGDALDSSSISSLLNLSDGILSDILNIAIIITYNCSTDKIDPALKRKGRLMIDYRFELLPVKESIKLAKSIGMSEEKINEIKMPMSLADIYHMNTKVEFSEPVVEKKIGFR